MHVIVVGCGRVGTGLATDLDAAGHSVVVIDRNPDAFRRLPDSFGGSTAVGVGFDRDLLVSAGIERADAVAAVTSGDNSNIVVARVAHESFEVERVVARIYDPARARIYQRLGVATVATSRWTVDQVMRRIDPDEHATEWTDPSGEVVLTGQPLPRELAGVAVGDIELGEVARIVAVSRGGTAQLCQPDLVLQEGDLVYFAAAADQLEELSDRFHAAAGGGH